MSSFGLAGKTTIVTGGNGGLGLAMAKGLASAGANLMIVGRNAAKTAAAIETIRSLGVEAAGIEAGVTSPRSGQDMVHGGRKAIARVELLVNNAGTNIST